MIRMQTRKELCAMVTFLAPLVLVSGLTMCRGVTEHQGGSYTTGVDSISVEMRKVLDRMFEKWYPLCIDTVYGGYFSDINYQWELKGSQNKMIVTQARHVWSTANAAMFYHKDNALRNVASHGVSFLRDVMWDKEKGGFYDLVNREGEPLKEDGEIVKRAYGNAFGIYGLAAYVRASGDANALALAKRAFLWLEAHSYDREHGGYVQFLTRDGTPMKEGYRGTPPKDQNSTIHLLESFAELYRVWPDKLLKERLNSLLHIIRDTITTDKGYMNLFFQRDWKPVSFHGSVDAGKGRNFELDHVSFGHDIETAYLLLEASDALGIENDTTTLRIAKKMVDHTMRNGWDKDHGGIFDGGYYYSGGDHITIVRNTKEWWPQVETLNSLLMMSDLFPDDSMHYYEKFCAQWDYCKKYLIDGEHGDWYWGGIDMESNNKYSPKGTIWKGTYHTSRSMVNCLNRLLRKKLHFGQMRSDPVN